MEPLSKKKVIRKKKALSPPRRPRRRWPLLLLGLFSLACVTSCSTMEPSLRLSQDQAPLGAPFHVVATWKNQVYYTPDPTRGGSPTPGLVGRLYLFGKEVGYPIGCNGSVVVDLFDCAPLAYGQQPMLLEEWHMDKDTLARLLHKDGIGWGYTLFLPWGTYRPDLRNVQLRVRYEPEGASPLYAAISQVTLQEDKPLFSPIVTTSGTRPPMPGAAPPPPMARPAEPLRVQSFNLARTPETAPAGVQPGASRP